MDTITIFSASFFSFAFGIGTTLAVIKLIQSRPSIIGNITQHQIVSDAGHNQNNSVIVMDDARELEIERELENG